MAEAKPATIVDIVTFNSVAEVNSFLDNEINKLRTQLGEYLRRLETVKAKADSIARFESLLAELAKASRGETRAAPSEEREFTLGTTKVIVNPSPKQELEALVAIVRSLQERLVLLERVKKSLEPITKMTDVEMKLDVILENSVPVKIFIRMS